MREQTRILKFAISALRAKISLTLFEVLYFGGKNQKLNREKQFST